MAALTTVQQVLAWDTAGPNLPDLHHCQLAVELLAEQGRAVADELRTQCLGVSAHSDAGVVAQAALGEASRRLHLPLPSPTPRATAHRAQNLARLVQSLTNAASEVAKERQRPREEPSSTGRGSGRAAAPP